jgi:hypothetical protein
MRASTVYLLTAAMAAIAIPAIAQVAAPQTAPIAAPATSSPDPAGRSATSSGPAETTVQEVSAATLPPPPPPIEYPAHARRDPWVSGVLDPAQHAMGAQPWRGASGAFLSTLMRRMNTPLASRWAHIALREALLARVRAPRQVHPVDWSAERAWLLLRMGEADAARMLIAGVDTDRFTPKMTQVAVQSALATADPPALCPIEAKIRRYDPSIRALVEAICSSLGGEPESASAQIDQARRFGRIGGIDLVLAEKVVGAGANTGRAVTVEWEPVRELTAWRFGLAAGTGMEIPGRLMERASPQLHAFYARAPLLTAEQRLDSAMIATGLGVLSSQSLVDLQSTIYDSTDAEDLSQTDAFQLRQAFIGRDQDARLAAIRKLLRENADAPEREARRALVARAATRIVPDSDLQADAPALISAMLAAGYDRQAARWAGALSGMNDGNGDRAWAMLVLGAPTTQGLDVSVGRISSFISRDTSQGKIRSALLVAGLAGMRRINTDAASSLNRRYRLHLGHRTSWTRMIDGAARRGQAGTVRLLAGAGLQAPSFDKVPPEHLLHIVLAMSHTGQDFAARMIAAEALSRT